MYRKTLLTILSFILIAIASCHPAVSLAATIAPAAPPLSVSPVAVAPATISAADGARPTPGLNPSSSTPVSGRTATLAAAPRTTAPRPAGLSAPSSISAFDAQAAYSHVEALAADIGTRATGTPGEQQAADYIYDTLQGYGYEVERTPFTYLYFGNEGASLSLVKPRVLDLELEPLTYTRGGQASGSLMNAGLARAEDFAGQDWSGKIALARRGELRFTEKVRNAAEAGAVAIIIYNSEPGIVQGALTGPSAIPAGTVSGETGQILLDAIGKGPAEVQLSMRTVSEYRTSYNVVARWPGSVSASVIIGGHYDSVAAGPGANDNASGTAVMLEAARVMAGIPGINFIGFSGEEVGLWGSQGYVDSLSSAQLGELAAMLNLDMVGTGDQPLAMEMYGRQSASLQAQALEVAADLSIPAKGGLSSGGSDHVPFADRGVPSLHFWNGMDPYNHTSGDTADKVSAAGLDVAGRVVVELAWRLLP